MKQSDNATARLAKSIVNAGLDIKLMIAFIKITLNDAHKHAANPYDVRERQELENFLAILQQIEIDHPWAIFTQETKVGDEAIFSNASKFIRLLQR
jgi:hypothetical protein